MNAAGQTAVADASDGLSSMTRLAVRPEKSRFYLRMAILFAIVAFVGFAPSYWMRIANGSITIPPILHLHGLLCFSWILFYLAQTALVTYGRTPDHRSWGMAGIALFTTMILTAAAARIVLMNSEEAQGFGDAGRRFAIFTFFDVLTLSVLFAIAIANVRRPEIHKRVMIVLGIALLPSAVARIFLATARVASGTGIAAHGPAGPPPVVFGLAPNLVTFLLLMIPMLYDRRVLGRVHPVYIYAGLWLVIAKSMMVPLAGTTAWMTTARPLQHLGG